MSRASCAQRDLGRRAVADHRPVAQNHDPVAELVHLLHEMGDVEDAVALGLQPAHHVEQAAALWQAQAGGGLVQDQHRGGAVDRLRELDQLPLAERQAVDLGVGIDVGTDQVAQQRARLRRASRCRCRKPRGCGRCGRWMFSATDRLPNRLSSWWMVPIPSRSASSVVERAIARTAKQDLAGIGRDQARSGCS